RGNAEGGDSRDRLLDGIDRCGVRDDVGQVDADEYHEQKLEQPLQEVLGKETHRLPLSERARESLPWNACAGGGHLNPSASTSRTWHASWPNWEPDPCRDQRRSGIRSNRSCP